MKNVKNILLGELLEHKRVWTYNRWIFEYKTIDTGITSWLSITCGIGWFIFDCIYLDWFRNSNWKGELTNVRD